MFKFHVDFFRGPVQLSSHQTWVAMGDPQLFVRSRDGSMVKWKIYLHEWLKFTVNVGKYTNAVVYFSHSFLFHVSTCGKKNNKFSSRHQASRCKLSTRAANNLNRTIQERGVQRRTSDTYMWEVHPFCEFQEVFTFFCKLILLLLSVAFCGTVTLGKLHKASSRMLNARRYQFFRWNLLTYENFKPRDLRDSAGVNRMLFAGLTNQVAVDISVSNRKNMLKINEYESKKNVITMFYWPCSTRV